MHYWYDSAMSLSHEPRRDTRRVDRSTNHLRLATLLLSICLTAFGSARAAEPLPAGSLSGTVIRPDGKPVAGASVLVDTYDYDAHDYRTVVTTTTREDGTFKIGPLEAVYRDRKSLRVQAQGFAPQMAGDGTITVYPGVDTNVGEIRLNRGQIISGQVIDIDGTPRAGARVECQAGCYSTAWGVSPLTPIYKLTTDTQGRFVTPPLPVSFAGFTVRVAGREMPWVRVPVGPEGRAGMEAIHLRQSTPIAGTVCDDAGKPLVGATVYGFNSAFDAGWLCDDRVTTDSRGRFVLDGLGPIGQLQINASNRLGINWGVRTGSDGIRWATVRGLVAKTEQLHGPVQELTITLSAVAWIEGSVTDADSGLPVHLKQIVRCSFTRKASGEVVLNGCSSPEFSQEADGAFRLPYESPDEYHLTLSAIGYQDAEAFTPLVTRLEPMNGITVKMHKAKEGEEGSVAHETISGVVQRDGQLVKTGWVALRQQVHKVRSVPQATIWRGRTVTNEGNVLASAVVSEGAYSLNVPYQGDWLVEMQEPGQPLMRIGGVTVGLNEAKKLDIIAVHGGIIGQVAGIPPKWANDTWVVAFTRTGAVYETRAGSDGRFSFGALPPDEYGLKAGHDAFWDAERPMDKLPDNDAAWTTPADPWKRAKVVKVASDQIVGDVRVELPGG
jgi:hypothetical protein